MPEMQVFASGQMTVTVYLNPNDPRVVDGVCKRQAVVAFSVSEPDMIRLAMNAARNATRKSTSGPVRMALLELR